MAKKSFSNPALNFITTGPTPTGPTGLGGPANAPMKLNPMYVETRSKRLQLLMQPSLHQKLKDRATERGQSLNDLIHHVLEEWESG
jgi:HicB family.